MEADMLWSSALELLQARKFDAAAEVFLQLAKENYKGAAFVLAGILADTNRSHQDLDDAIFWYEKVINEEGNIRAMVALARIYAIKGGEANFSRALHFLGRAAEVDDLVALSVLGEIAENGYFAARDVQNAEHYYAKAAELGGVYAMLRLANLCFSKKEIIKGISWKLKALRVAVNLAVTAPNDHRLWRVYGRKNEWLIE